MSIFNFWKRDDSGGTPATTPAPIKPEVDDVLLKALIAREPITREQAMTIPAVSGAVDFIANTIASMPIKLYKVKDGRVESRDDDTRVRLLNSDTADTLDAFQMKKAAVEDFLMAGNGYIYIRRFRNEVTGLFYTSEEYVTPLLVNSDPIFKKRNLFVYEKEYDLFDFIKLLRNTKDGAEGVGLTAEVAKALETAYNTMLYQLSAVKSGGNKKGFLKSQRKLGQEEINVLKQAWRNMYANNTENVVVLNNGLEFQESSNSIVEMQLDQNKKTLTDEINRIFHIHEDFFQTYKEAIYPIVKAFETALNRDLLLEKEKKNMFFELDPKEILRTTPKERAEYYKLAKEGGWMTINEMRRAENMDKIEGMDVVNVGLSAVLYDTNTHQYYTPNTGATQDADGGIKKEIIDHDIISEEEADGNIRYNHNHDHKTGRFTTGSGGGAGGGASSGSGSSEADNAPDQLTGGKNVKDGAATHGLVEEDLHRQHTEDGRDMILEGELPYGRYFLDKNKNIYQLDKKAAGRNEIIFNKVKDAKLRPKSDEEYAAELPKLRQTMEPSKAANGSDTGYEMNAGGYQNAIKFALGGEKQYKEFNDACRDTLNINVGESVYDAGKKRTAKYLASAESNAVVEKSKQFLPVGSKIYRADNSADGVSWTTDRKVAERYAEKSGAKILEHTLTNSDRYIAPEFTEAFNPNVPQSEVLFSVKGGSNEN